MGKLTCRATFTTRTGTIRRNGKIDSGADYTVIGWSDGCRLGLDPATAQTAAIGGIGQARLAGFLLPTTITVQKHSADIVVFVSYHRIIGRSSPALKPIRGKTPVLIGHDFLQAVGAVLDFKQHRIVLSGYDELSWPFSWELQTVTREEETALRRLRCPRR